MKMQIFSLMILSLSANAQDYLTISNFYNKLGDAKDYILMKPINDQREDYLLMPLKRAKGLNHKYVLDQDNYFETDTDAIIARTQTTPLIDARIKLFEEFKYDAVEAGFHYPHPILTYWDILPHPPIKKIDREKNYYTNTYLDQNIGQNPELLSESFNLELDKITNSELTFGNKIKVLQNRQVIDQLVKLLNETKSHVLASNMFLTCDSSLTPLTNLMAEKIKSGVNIHLILERVFALKYSKCFKAMKKIGVKVTYSNNMIKLKNRFVYHNKFWIFDSKKAVVYGANLMDAQVESTGFNQMYRDAGLLLEGPIVNQLSRDYLKLHHFIKGDEYPNLVKVSSDVEKLIKEDVKNNLRGTKNLKPLTDLDGMCRVVFQGPQNKNPKAVTDLYKKLVDAAKNSIFMTSSRLPLALNFAKDKDTATILETMFKKAQAKADFNIDIMTNNWLTPTDVKSKNYSSGGFFTMLYKKFAKSEDTFEIVNGVRKYLDRSPKNFNVWNYFNYYHGKMMMVDNTLSVTGSFNMNRNSNEKSFEMALVCHDKKTISELQRSMISDMINSIPILE